ncbi:substrate-binding domain-containing protein [Pseudomonas lini]
MMKTFIQPWRAPLAMLAVTLSCVAEVGAEELTIGYAVPSLSQSFWISSAYGAQDEASKEGVKLIKLSAGGDGNVAQQISQLQSLIQRRVGAIVVGATNGDAVRAVVDQAVRQGIAVIGISSPPNSQHLTSIVTADHYDMGRMQAECLGEALQGQGDVAMLAGPAGQAWSDLRAQGFRQTLKDKFPGINVVAQSRLADNRNASLNTTEDWLQRFANLKGIYSATEDMAAGAVAALRASGRLEQVKVSTSNFSPTTRELLANNEVVCSSVQQVVEQGRSALRLAVAAAHKQSVEKVVSLPALKISPQDVATINLDQVMAPASYTP